MGKYDNSSESIDSLETSEDSFPSWEEVNQGLKNHDTVLGYEIVDRRSYFTLNIDGSPKKKNLPISLKHTPGEKTFRQPTKKRSGALAASEIGNIMAEEQAELREAQIDEDSLYIEIGLGDRIFAYEDWSEPPQSPYMDESLENYPKGPESYECKIEL